MADVSSDSNLLTVFVSFDVEPDQQEKVCELVEDYIANFISLQAGFVSSHVHKSLCGKHVANYAQWKSMEHFKAFGEKARSWPGLPALLEFGPQATFYTVVYGADAAE